MIGSNIILYIPCVIDVYSRYASCRAMTNRRNETILDEIKSIFDEIWVIDVYSRYASCRAMTNRRNGTILDVIKSIFDEMGIPKAINADNEFNKSTLNTYFNQNNIICYFSQPDEINKNASVERFNRTLTHLINKWRLSTGSYDWYKILNDIVKNYNNTYHRTIKTKPIKIKDGDDINRQNCSGFS